MIFEDGRAQVESALRLLATQKEALNIPALNLQTVPEFLESVRTATLTRQEKETLVEQAILLLEEFYAHLPYKRARYATDPVQRLRLIQARLDRYTDLVFHERMIQAFTQLRDAHTFYNLPAPYRGASAFLPFRMDCYYDESGQARFLVTNVLEGFEHVRFREQAEITLWQGIPVATAIERAAEQESGGNSAARFARGLRRLTKRSLSTSVPPDEQFVVLQYQPPGETEEYAIALPWTIATSSINAAVRQGSCSSVNESMAQMKQLSDILWNRDNVSRQKQMARMYGNPAGGGVSPTIGGAEVDLNFESKYPQAFEFQYAGAPARRGFPDPGRLQDPKHPDQKFAYLRIKTFDLDPSDETASDKFVEEFARILTLLQAAAPAGLILDVRSNPGGAIDAAERIFQLLTPAHIEPAKFHFLNSRQMQRIARKLKEGDTAIAVDSADEQQWTPWIDDLLASVLTGDFVTAGRSLTPLMQVNGMPQIYQGPVALLVDASSYSATDIFAAGFQDHGIGDVIGVDENTGGGGANRWLQDDIRLKLKDILPEVPFKELPGGATMGLAIRRSSRVGPNYGGTFLEDDGVTRDVAYSVTRNDILHFDADLLPFVCAHLGALPAPLLKILKAEMLEPDGVGLTVETRNVYRIDCFLDGQPQCTFRVEDGIHAFLVTTMGLATLPPSLVRVDAKDAGLRTVAGAHAPVTSDPAGSELAKATA